MSYIYTLELKLAKKSSTINLRDYSKEIQDCIADYNSASEKAANRKSLERIEIQDISMLLRLRSSLELIAIGKALRYFSQLAIKRIPPLQENLTGSGQLFRINQIGLPVSEEDPKIQEIQLLARTVSDAALLKGLVDYVCRKRDPNTSVYLKKQKAVEQMKQLAVEAGIIVL